MRRAATSGSAPRFVRMVRDLVLERAAAEHGEPVTRDYVGSTGPLWDRCPVGCCAGGCVVWANGVETSSTTPVNEANAPGNLMGS